jgi:hypothetical protein
MILSTVEESREELNAGNQLTCILEAPTGKDGDDDDNVDQSLPQQVQTSGETTSDSQSDQDRVESTARGETTTSYGKTTAREETTALAETTTTHGETTARGKSGEDIAAKVCHQQPFGLSTRPLDFGIGNPQEDQSESYIGTLLTANDQGGENLVEMLTSNGRIEIAPTSNSVDTTQIRRWEPCNTKEVFDNGNPQDSMSNDNAMQASSRSKEGIGAMLLSSTAGQLEKIGQQPLPTLSNTTMRSHGEYQVPIDKVTAAAVVSVSKV